MTETKCLWCKRDVSKHDSLALRICLLKAIRDKDMKDTTATEGLEKLVNIEDTQIKEKSKDD